MSLPYEYIKALHKRSSWLKWSTEQGSQAWEDIGRIGKTNYVKSLPQYIKTLDEGETYFMNSKFCSLVNHARQTIPDDLTFELSWLQSQAGWMWIEEPFDVPEFIMENSFDEAEKQIINSAGIRGATTNGVKVKISAIGWFPLPEGLSGKSLDGKEEYNIPPGTTQFTCFQDFSQYYPDSMGFGCWSFFHLKEGDKIIDRINRFESLAGKERGAYVINRSRDMLHEIRWIYAAIYLMSQRLAITIHRDTDRGTKRRGIRDGMPVADFLKVISLRRMEQERKKAGEAGKHVDWNWQWLVGGHWRNQYMPSTGEHKVVWIEDFMKGPKDKPIKPIGQKIFVARR